MTQQEHELLCRLKEEVDGIRSELIGFVKRLVVWIVVAAFGLGGWSAAIQAQVLEQSRVLERIDAKGSDWGHTAKEGINGQFSEIQQTLGRIDERLSAIEKAVAK